MIPQAIRNVRVEVAGAETVGSGRVRPSNRNTVGVGDEVEPPSANV
jgi:hypothetical protein